MDPGLRDSPSVSADPGFTGLRGYGFFALAPVRLYERLHAATDRSTGRQVAA
jgi:hypothetical protein